MKRKKYFVVDIQKTIDTGCFISKIEYGYETHKDAKEGFRKLMRSITQMSQ